MPASITEQITLTVEGRSVFRELASPKVLLFESYEDDATEADLFAEAALWLKKNDWAVVIATSFQYEIDENYIALTVVVE